MALFDIPYWTNLVLSVLAILVIMFYLYSSRTHERVKLPLIGYVGLIVTIPIPILNIIPFIVLLGYMGKDYYIANKSMNYAKFIDFFTKKY